MQPRADRAAARPRTRHRRACPVRPPPPRAGHRAVPHPPSRCGTARLRCSRGWRCPAPRPARSWSRRSPTLPRPARAGPFR
ncbi:MAG: hypothetical protein EHM24_32720 [Acidobacteria bacterium]|nr:MAG: hypothetical protein EHM24_32720 [Acidobacteriota bacterium]